MKSFTDNAGRAWTLSLTVAAIKRVRSLVGIDLANVISLDPGEAPKLDILERLGNDPILLVDTLYAICQPEANRRGISDVEFGEGMAGDSIELACTALLDEIIAFFPEAKRRVLEKIVAATRRFKEKAKAALEEALANRNLDEAIDAEINRLNNLSMNLQES